MTRLLTAFLLALLTTPARANDPPDYVDPPAFTVGEPKKPACVCGDACECTPGACPGKCPAAGKPTDPKASTVYVRRDLGGGMAACGTGTVIASEAGCSLILTNAHVVEDAARPVTIIHETDGQPWSYTATYLGGSSVSTTGPGSIHVNGPDLCLLSVNFELPAVEIATDLPAPGTPVRQYGFGGRMPGHKPTEKVGVVIAPRISSPCLNTTIPSQSGDSGSGIFNADGQMVGVCWGAGECQYAVRLDAVHAFTVSVLDGRKGWFPRLKERLAARRLAREAARSTPPPAIPPAAPGCPDGACRPQAPGITPSNPFGGGCPGGNCPAPSGRGRFRR
ncbi:MAG: hypothetical protein JWO38_6842 [Gemmataceae bacterium]|nr:hypothetical protein [Gemmataceae bacterium]